MVAIPTPPPAGTVYANPTGPPVPPGGWAVRFGDGFGAPFGTGAGQNASWWRNQPSSAEFSNALSNNPITNGGTEIGLYNASQITQDANGCHNTAVYQSNAPFSSLAAIMCTAPYGQPGAYAVTSGHTGFSFILDTGSHATTGPWAFEYWAYLDGGVYPAVDGLFPAIWLSTLNGWTNERDLTEWHPDGNHLDTDWIFNTSPQSQDLWTPRSGSEYTVGGYAQDGSIGYNLNDQYHHYCYYIQADGSWQYFVDGIQQMWVNYGPFNGYPLGTSYAEVPGGPNNPMMVLANFAQFTGAAGGTAAAVGLPRGFHMRCFGAYQANSGPNASIIGGGLAVGTVLAGGGGIVTPPIVITPPTPAPSLNPLPLIRHTSVGVTYEAGSPAFIGTSDAVIGSSVGGANVSTLTGPGQLGDSLTVPPLLTTGGYDWSQLPGWVYLDDRVAHMNAENVAIKMITIASAPLFMLNNPNGDSAATMLANLQNYPVATAWNTAFADLCHYIVNRYLYHDVMYYAIWSNCNGYINGSRLGYEAYTTLYNTAYAAIKADPFTLQAQIGGPGFTMTQTQAGYAYASSYMRTPIIGGSWGTVDPNITDGVNYWAHNATGYEFVAYKMDARDISGGNPSNFTETTIVEYFGAVPLWMFNTNIITNPDGNIVPQAATEARGFDFTTITAALAQTSNNGLDMFMVAHGQTASGSVVDGRGNLTDCGPELATANTAAVSLLTPTYGHIAPAYFPSYAPSAMAAPQSPFIVQHKTGSLFSTGGAPEYLVASFSGTLTKANNDIYLIFTQYMGIGTGYPATYSLPTGYTQVASIINPSNAVPCLVVYRYAGAPPQNSVTVNINQNVGGVIQCGFEFFEVANSNTSAPCEVLFSGYNPSNVTSWTLPGIAAPSVAGELQILAMSTSADNSGTGNNTVVGTDPPGWTVLDSAPVGGQDLFTFEQVSTTATAPSASITFADPNTIVAVLISIPPKVA